MIVRMASGLFVLALATSCKDKPAKAPPPPATQGSGSGSTIAPVAVVVDAAPAPLPIDAANLPEVTAAERAMVTKWFARLNGTGKLEIKGVDVEPFRKRHLGQILDAKATVAYAAPPKEGKRAFVVVFDKDRVYMTFDDKDALVGISY